MMRLLTILTILAISAAASAQWCLDADDIGVEVNGAQVTVRHDGAYYNCCPDPFAYEVTFADGVMTVTEDEVLSTPCFCLCCYDLWAVVDDVPPGAWSLVFNWYDYEINAWVSETLSFEVPDTGQSAAAALGDTYKSECLIDASADDPELAWGGVKTLYR